MTMRFQCKCYRQIMKSVNVFFKKTRDYWHSLRFICSKLEIITKNDFYQPNQDNIDIDELLIGIFNSDIDGFHYCR